MFDKCFNTFCLTTVSKPCFQTITLKINSTCRPGLCSIARWLCFWGKPKRFSRYYGVVFSAEWAEWATWHWCPSLYHPDFLLDDCFPINLLRRMTIKIPPIKKTTGANTVVYLIISGISGVYGTVASGLLWFPDVVIERIGCRALFFQYKNCNEAKNFFQNFCLLLRHF